MEASPSRVLELVKPHLQPRTLTCRWLVVEGGRSEFASAMRSANTDNLPVVPMIVRSITLDSPDSFMADLVRLLESAREDLEPVALANMEALGVCLLMISHVPLRVAQMSSPATLPTWLPVLGGQQVTLTVADLLKVAMAPMNAPECRLDMLAEALWEVEGVLVRRLSRRFSEDRGVTMSLWDQIKPDKSGDLGEFLKAAKNEVDGVANPRGYRPSVRNAKSLVSRLIATVSGKAPDALMKIGGALHEALGTFSGPMLQPLLAVLLRPTNPENPGQLSGRSLLVTVFATSQMLTAGAHSDAYPNKSVSVLEGQSRDLLESLHSSILALRD